MEDANLIVWMHRSKAETDHGGLAAGKAAIDAAVAAGFHEERVIFGGRNEGGNPCASQIRVRGGRRARRATRSLCPAGKSWQWRASRADFAAAVTSGFEQVSTSHCGHHEQGEERGGEQGRLKRPAALAIAEMGSTSEDQVEPLRDPLGQGHEAAVICVFDGVSWPSR